MLGNGRGRVGGSNVEKYRNLVSEFVEWGFAGSHFDYRATHTPDISLAPITRLFNHLVNC